MMNSHEDKHRHSSNNEHHSSHKHRHTHDKSSDLERRKINSQYKELKNKKIVLAIKRAIFIIFVFSILLMAIYFANNPNQTVGIRKFNNNKSSNINKVDDYEKRLSDIEEKVRELEQKIAEYEKLITNDNIE